MRGQYSHNTGVWTNDIDGTDAGWATYQKLGHEEDNVATRLDAAGYRTGLLGKYLNGYEGTAVPPGWDDWFATFNDTYFESDVNDNGQLKHLDASEKVYMTDVLMRQTRQFIGSSASAGEPFFAYVAPKAPHGISNPAPRDEHTYDGEKAPRLPSFNEADVSDKPPWIQSKPKRTAAQIASIDARHEARAETLQALDDLVKGVVGKLRDEGELENTFIVFTSDNGWHHGEHRIPADKWRPYEEDISVPLLVRGPGIQAGSTARKLVLNTDYLPTFTDLAGVLAPEYVDGRSLRPLLEGNQTTTWRSAILLEAAQRYSPAYYGIRTNDGRMYVEYEGGYRELYRLNTDPYELANSYDATAPPTNLAQRLHALKSCAGVTGATSCRAAEDGP